jgi:hypothetical protein
MQTGRLLIVVHDVSGDTQKWALPCVAYGADLHAGSLPPSGSMVWVEFEGGDIDRPVWLGWMGGSVESPSYLPRRSLLFRQKHPLPATIPRSQ